MRWLGKLLAKGKATAIHNGRIAITPVCNKKRLAEWLAANSMELLAEIARATGLNVFVYEHYSTGHYGQHKSPGITLHYRNVVTGEPGYLTFNADLTRARSTKTGRKGEALPKGQFRVRPGSAFTRYWQTTLGLENPRRLSDFHDRMGKIGTVFIVADYAKKGGLDKHSIQLLDLTARQVREAFLIGQLPDNYPTKSRQAPDNYPTSTPDKEIAEGQSALGFQGDFSACENKYVLSNKVMMCKGSGNLPRDQSHAAWLDDYDRG